MSSRMVVFLPLLLTPPFGDAAKVLQSISPTPEEMVMMRPLVLVTAVLALAACGGGKSATILIGVLGSSIVIQNAVMLVAGKRNVFFPEIRAVRLHPLGPVTVTSVQIVIVCASAALMAGLYVLFNRTRFGLRIRAVAENRMAAELVGISTRSVLERVFLSGPALGGAAGALFASYLGEEPDAAP